MHDPAAPETDTSKASSASSSFLDVARIKVSRTPVDVLTIWSSTDVGVSIPPLASMAADDVEPAAAGAASEVFEAAWEPRVDDRRVVRVARPAEAVAPEFDR